MNVQSKENRDALRHALLDEFAQRASEQQGAPFQSRVRPWMLECFGAEIASDRVERNHRFFEEASELVQACGMTASEAHQLVDYTWSRPIGEPNQEAGGVMVTLAALCLANGLDMHVAGETELARISKPDMVIRIRAKQAAKPKHSPLPEATKRSCEQIACDVLREMSRFEAEMRNAFDYTPKRNPFAEVVPHAEEAYQFGHGHVTPRPDGYKARCGGPAMCHVCQAEQARLPETRMEPPPMPAVKPARVATAPTMSEVAHGLRVTRAEIDLIVSDPMSADHVEVSKRALRRWRDAIDRAAAKGEAE